jgi:hypothetical protein
MFCQAYSEIRREHSVVFNHAQYHALVDSYNNRVEIDEAFRGLMNVEDVVFVQDFAAFLRHCQATRKRILDNREQAP